MTALIYIGFDPREREASDVCRASIERHSPKSEIRDLKLTDPDVKEAYDRPFYQKGVQLIDRRTEKPFSTEFAFSRFLVPYLARYEGWHIFVDADFLFRASLRDLWRLQDDRYAVRVVKHDHVARETSKMDGVAQTTYARKNWSSLILWNCGHPKNLALTPDFVNHADGLELHQFQWLDPHDIGELPLAWNYLVGYHSAEDCPDPKAVHFTSGGPWWSEYDDVEFAEEWRKVRASLA